MPEGQEYCAHPSPWTGSGHDHGGPTLPAGPSPDPRAAQSTESKGPPCVGGSEPSRWLPSEDAVDAGSAGSLPRQKRLARCARLSWPPGRLQTGQQNGGRAGLEPVPGVAKAGARRTTGASTAAPPPGHGAVATQGGLRPCITQHGSLPFRASSGARTSGRSCKICFRWWVRVPTPSGGHAPAKAKPHLPRPGDGTLLSPNKTSSIRQALGHAQGEQGVPVTVPQDGGGRQRV